MNYFQFLSIYALLQHNAALIQYELYLVSKQEFFVKCIAEVDIICLRIRYSIHIFMC